MKIIATPKEGFVHIQSLDFEVLLTPNEAMTLLIWLYIAAPDEEERLGQAVAHTVFLPYSPLSARGLEVAAYPAGDDYDEPVLLLGVRTGRRAPRMTVLSGPEVTVFQQGLETACTDALAAFRDAGLANVKWGASK